MSQTMRLVTLTMRKGLRRSEFLDVLPAACPQIVTELFGIAERHRVLLERVRPRARDWETIDVWGTALRYPFFSISTRRGDRKFARRLFPVWRDIDLWSRRWNLPYWVGPIAWRHLMHGLLADCGAAAFCFEPFDLGGPRRRTLADPLPPMWDPLFTSEEQFDDAVRQYKREVLAAVTSRYGDLVPYAPIDRRRLGQLIRYHCGGERRCDIVGPTETEQAWRVAMRRLEKSCDDGGSGLAFDLQLTLRAGDRGPSVEQPPPEFVGLDML